MSSNENEKQPDTADVVVSAPGPDPAPPVTDDPKGAGKADQVDVKLQPGEAVVSADQATNLVTSLDELASTPSGDKGPSGEPSGVRKPPYPGLVYAGAKGPWLDALRQALAYDADTEDFREGDRVEVAAWQADHNRVTRNGYPDRGDWDAIFEGV